MLLISNRSSLQLELMSGIMEEYFRMSVSERFTFLIVGICLWHLTAIHDEVQYGLAADTTRLHSEPFNRYYCSA